MPVAIEDGQECPSYVFHAKLHLHKGDGARGEVSKPLRENTVDLMFLGFRRLELPTPVLYASCKVCNICTRKVEAIIDPAGMDYCGSGALRVTASPRSGSTRKLSTV